MLADATKMQFIPQHIKRHARRQESRALDLIVDNPCQQRRQTSSLSSTLLNIH